MLRLCVCWKSTWSFFTPRHSQSATPPRFRFALGVLLRRPGGPLAHPGLGGQDVTRACATAETDVRVAQC